ncbi:hypothetical protein D3C77_578380 [compost metagenome]
MSTFTQTCRKWASGAAATICIARIARTATPACRRGSRLHAFCPTASKSASSSVMPTSPSTLAARHSKRNISSFTGATSSSAMPMATCTPPAVTSFPPSWSATCHFRAFTSSAWKTACSPWRSPTCCPTASRRYTPSTSRTKNGAAWAASPSSGRSPKPCAWAWTRSTSATGSKTAKR